MVIRKGPPDIDSVLLPLQRWPHDMGASAWEPERDAMLGVLIPLARRAAAALLARTEQLHPHIVDGVKRWDALGWAVRSWDPRGDYGDDEDVVLLLIDGSIAAWKNRAQTLTPLGEMKNPLGAGGPIDGAHLRSICSGILEALWWREWSDEDIRAVGVPHTYDSAEQMERDIAYGRDGRDRNPKWVEARGRRAAVPDAFSAAEAASIIAARTSQGRAGSAPEPPAQP